MILLSLITLLILSCSYAAPADNTAGSTKSHLETQKDRTANNDLNTDASTYYDRYSDYGSRGYGVGGYGPGYGASGYGFGGYSITGYGAVDDNYGYDRSYPGSYGGGLSGYSSNDGYRGYSAGYGGYGGYGGNGGLNSYYGYNNPSYQGYGHLGYGYYNRRPGYGNIYNAGITPSLVTGYRGYSRK